MDENQIKLTFDKIRDIKNCFNKMNKYQSYQNAINIVIDIETCGLPHPINKYSILSIGSVCILPKAPVPIISDDKFYNIIDRESSKKLGFIEDYDTMSWWDKQQDDVKCEVLKPHNNTAEIAITNFIEYIHNILINNTQNKTVYIWGNAPKIDIDFVSNYLYKIFNIEALFPYWCERDVRTFTNQMILPKDRYFDIVNNDNNKKLIHNALYDAENEAKLLIEAIIYGVAGQMSLNNELR